GGNKLKVGYKNGAADATYGVTSSSDHLNVLKGDADGSFTVKHNDRSYTVKGVHPFASKSDLSDFSKEKSDLTHYPELARALHLVSKLETDLYKDSLIPIALAHRHASISVRPGGRILDALSRATRSGAGDETIKGPED
ncbi:MAG: hypothetical protein VCA36_02870, partial [Opitutales bacterium]